MSIPFIDQAFLPEYEDLFHVSVICGAGVAFIIQFCIGAMAKSKLRRSDSKIDREFVFLFFLSFVCALLYTSGTVTSYVVYMSHGSRPEIMIVLFICGFCYFSFFLVLLITLVIRLQVTFKDSALKMSKSIIYSFVVLFVVLFVLNIVIFIGHILPVIGGNAATGLTLHRSAGFPFLFLYITGCALAVRLFVMNLSALAQMQAGFSGSQRSLSADDISLNCRQEKLLRLASKYMLLFFVAILSSVCSILLFFIVSSECIGLFASIDLCVNLQCLYLQFAFAAKEYFKCCGCLNSRCTSMVLNRAKRNIYKQALSLQNKKRIHVASVSGTLSIQTNRSGTIEM